MDVPHILTRLHCRAIRAVIRDPKQSRHILDTISRRATPAQWARYTVASTAIHIIDGSYTRLVEELRNKMYVNGRMHKKSKFLNTARTKIGQQCFAKRIN